jgi:hypothetical protein
MTLEVKHPFVSGKSDGVDSSLVQPSNWNAGHTITLAAGKIIGRDSSGAGAAQELGLSFAPGGDATFGGAVTSTGDITSGLSVVIGTGGSTNAGSIAADANYGMRLRALTTSPATAVFGWFNQAGSALMTLVSGALSVGGNVVAVLSLAQAWTKPQRPQATYTNASSTGTLDLDVETYTDFALTLTGALTLQNPSTLASTNVGQRGSIRLIQDGSGNRALTALGSYFKWVGGTGTPELQTAASAVDRMDYHIVSTTRIEYVFNPVEA